MVGRTISHYKILEKIGQGGMGEVYRAEDTSLKREVAIKVLPEQFTEDPQRLARFEREAQLLASLNHPNIAVIHSFEHSDDIHFLVLELVEGETLAERIAKGPLPVEEALEACRQIVEGVEAAHEKGVLHRDLKPANVKITPEGKVKILDFGLAKAFEGETPVTNISQSPTLTEEMTKAGVILGTAAYMSPEQAKGKPVDKRADIFAFGCVLYELLTGKRTFHGETIAETLAAVLKSEPDWEALPEITPWRIRDLLRRCLEKDPHLRLHDVANVRIEIHEAVKEPSTVSPAGVVSTAQTTLWKRAIWWSIASLVVGGIITGLLTWNLKPSPPPGPGPVTRFSVELPGADLPARLSLVALSPDGSRFVYNSNRLSPDGSGLVYDSNRLLYLRGMNELEARPIPGTEGAYAPFFSPDGQWLGFFVGFFQAGQLKKIPISGGASVTLCDAIEPWGASWGADDRIVFGQGPEGIWQVPANGGTKELLINVDSAKDERALGPQVLPGGKTVLFTVAARRVEGAAGQASQIVVQSLETGERKVLINGGRDARYVPTGHLVYTREGNLLAVPMDIARLEVTGDPVSIIEGISQATGSRTAQFSFSDSGSLIYVRGTSDKRMLVWVDREGQEERLAAEPRVYSDPRLSPDGGRLATTVNDSGNVDIWIYDLARKTATRFTFDPAVDDDPLWTPDGQRVLFRSNREGGQQDLFWRAADGTGQVERLTTGPENLAPYFFLPDGKSLVFMEPNRETGWDLHVLSMEGERTSKPFLQTPFNEFRPAISPDGQWMAYMSNESGRYEIYVRPFPQVEEGKWQISSEGAENPLWGPNGRELFYGTGEAIVVVNIETEPTFTPGKPEVLITGRYFASDLGRHYDISPDGKRFLMLKPAGQTEETSAPTESIVVLNWFEELKRLVPTN